MRWTPGSSPGVTNVGVQWASQPDRLANLRLRVRGYIEERSGPRIEATRPEQIEIAESK